MDLAAIETIVTFALSAVASIVSLASLARIVARGRFAEAGGEELRRTDLLWTAVPVLLLVTLLGGVLAHVR
jgi:hypothetical protein